MGAKVHSIISKGNKGTLVDIECHLSNNLPTIIIVGSASKAVDESRERIRGAFASSHIMLPRKRITVNLAPADIPKADSGFDLAIAVSILAASGQVLTSLSADQAFIGELGLDGSTRAVRGVIGKLLIGRAKGVKTFFIPADNLPQAQLIPQITLIPIIDLEQLYNYLAMSIPIKIVKTGASKPPIRRSQATKTGVQLSEVVGQQQAKRALEIAAAGGHNVFFSGPPGTGKSMLAKALPSVLPPLTGEEMLEVTHLHSLASHNYEQIVTERPFRTPHHSASHIAIVGGGSHLRPGEISLAHRGVLFFDELPEFDRETLEALRQPLEDRVISLARAKETAEYPASFIMIATANPCPCGFYGSKRCDCHAYELLRYKHKISGPIMDRIDLYTTVSGIDHRKILSQEVNPRQDAAVRQNILKARQLQANRYGNTSRLNADMTNQDIKIFAKLSDKAAETLNSAAQRGDLSVRGYMRTLKVARTIADLDTSASITKKHLSEALSYKYRPVNEE